MLLADVFSLHGQEQLQLRALDTAAALASVQHALGAHDSKTREGVERAAVSRLALAVECGLAGMSIYIYIYVYVNKYLYICIHLYVYLYIYIHIYKYTCMHVC